jgi:DNA excision repair protein ERCC-2
MKFCNVVALTYGYLINPFMRKILFQTLDTSIAKCILVFDECHNLPNMAMHAMSLGVSNRGLKRALKECTRFDPTGSFAIVPKFIQYFQHYLSLLSRDQGSPPEEVEVPIDAGAILTYLKEFMQKHHLADLYALANSIHALGKQIRRIKLEKKQAIYSSIEHFGKFLEHFITTIRQPQYLHYVIVSKDRVQYYIRCIDCRGILKPLQKARGLVCMSGTLEPIQAFLDICGFPSATRRKVLPSPFNHEKIRVFGIRGFDVSYYSRTTPQYQLLMQRCLEVVQGTPGNSAFFCASYDVLEGFLQATDFKRAVERLGRPFYHEKRDKSSAANNLMIAEFKKMGALGKKAVLVGVCGGRNSEGVDFPGAEMITVCILGIPLARWTHSVISLINYYTEQFGIWKGKEYAYTLPAFRRTNQAAGRPIRTLRDYGVVVLLDERYTHPYYRRFLSAWLNENMEILPNEEGLLQREIEQFYALHELVGGPSTEP